MFRPLSLYIGLRYTRAKRRNHFISFITLVSLLGIALGITALITVLSVMNGFEKEVRTRILSMAAHVTISMPNGGISDWRATAREVSRDDRVRAAAPYVQGEGMLSHTRGVSGALITGVLPETETGISEVAHKMIAGRLADLAPGDFGIVLGRELARLLGVTRGDKVTLIIPQVSVTPIGILPRLKRFTVVGLFEVGMYEYDRGTAYIHMADAQRLYGLGTHVTGVRLKLGDMFQAPAVTQKLLSGLSQPYYVSDWTREHANYFHAVRTEKRVMFIILTLIVAVAVFNIVSALTMVVTDKSTDIAILRTLGASPASIMRIFFVQGGIIGMVGTQLGLVCGVALALNVETLVPAIERMFDVQFLSADVYYITEFPSDLHWSDVWLVCGMSLLLTVLATLYPAARAGRVAPAEALRYE